MQLLFLYTSYMQVFALHTLSMHVFRHTLNLCDPHRKSNTPGIFCSRNERPFNYTSGLRQGPLPQSVSLTNPHLCFPRDFLPALSVAPGLNSHWEHHWRGGQCLSPLGRAKWKEPPVCRGWRPVSRRRGSWRLRDTPGISRCLNTPLWPRIRCRRVAVEAWHGQSAAMPSPGISSSFYLFQYHCDTNRVPKFFLLSAFVYIPEGGG